jgi:membrane protease subunit HflK
MRDLNELLAVLMPYRKALGLIGIILVAGMVVSSSYYKVELDEEAVVTRWGKYLETTNAGPHLKIPLVDEVFILKTKKVLQEEFGFRSIKEEGNNKYVEKNDESNMLSGDLNVADVEWVVQYQISEPAKYLFNTKTPQQNIRDVSESVMRRLVGDRLVSEVLTTGRMEISSQAKELIQKVLSRYDQGTIIVGVQLQEINPPEEVKSAFNEVSKAKQDQEKMINDAEKEYNRIIPKAQGLAREAISSAEGYATKVKNQALGDVMKFDKIQAEYKLAPAITRKRIYLETMEQVYKDRKIIFVDSNLQSSIVPLYNLNQSKKTQEKK